MIRSKLIILSIAIISSLNIKLQGQEVAVDARLDTTDILIGDQIKLNIAFTMPLDYRVIWPFYQDTLVRNVEIIGQTAVDTMINEGENLVNMMQSLTITSFDSGSYYVPPLRFLYQPIDDTAYNEAFSMPLYLEVHTMEVDTTQAIKAIKPPLEAPFSIREILPWILLALAALFITFLIVYILTRIKRKQPVFVFRPKPALPPHIIAINGLENLKTKKLWQSGKIKDYYTELTDIVRVYIEDRFDVAAVEMTTDEILNGMKQTPANQASVDKLAKTLVLADLVKFAKEQPLPLENDNSMTYCMEFVQDTKAQPENPEQDNKVNEDIISKTEKN